MKKRITGGVLIAATMAMAFQNPQLLAGITGTNATTQQAELNKGESDVERIIQKGNEKLPANQMPITWMETIDGDTIKARINGKVETIRYLLVDTPESKKPGMCVQPYAKEAAERNDQLVRRGRLTIELENGNTRDDYGRMLAYVYVDGKSVQETLLEEGYARVAYIMNPPYKYLTLFKADEKIAKGNQVKIWSRKNYVSFRGFIGCLS